MQLETRTIVVVAALVALIPGIIGSVVWYTRRTYPGRWALGNLLSALGLLLICLRGKVPDFISVVLANALVFASTVVIFQGIRKFRGLRIVWWPESSMAVAAIAAVTYFRYVSNDINVRILVISLALGSAGVACGITLLRKMPRGRRIGLVITGVASALGAIHLSRGIYVFEFAPVKNLFDNSPSNSFLFLAVALGIASWSFGFFVLIENGSQLRQLAANLQAVREEERTNIARELHDELGQMLTALKMDIEDLAFRVAQGQHGLAVRFQSTIAHLDAAIQNGCAIVTDLRPAVLDLGLVEAVEWLLEDHRTRTRIEYALDRPAFEIVLDADRSTAIFRILQEALTNVARHSAATRIDVRLAVNNGVLTLEVRDNGMGISSDTLRGQSLGIMGMSERARSLGGEASVARQAEGGTIVRARIPLTQQEAAVTLL